MWEAGNGGLERWSGSVKVGKLAKGVSMIDKPVMTGVG